MDKQKDKIINRQLGLKTNRYEDKYIDKQQIIDKQIDGQVDKEIYRWINR